MISPTTLVLSGFTIPITGITALVLRYREGEAIAGQLLLDRFAPYISKWVRLLSMGAYSRKDQEIVHFLRMLGSTDTEKTSKIIYYRMRSYEREDLLQETRVALLDTARRYGKIVAYYRYVLKERVSALMVDPLVRGYGTHQEIEEEEIGDLDVQELDRSWVEGLTCSQEFLELTPRDREILRMVKGYGFSIQATANSLGVSVSTVNRALAKSKEILRIYYFGS
jgi:RNA polymerase sigma factor (sigma-70 family)